MNNKQYVLGDKVNAQNINAFNVIKRINPKYAEHMYFKNRIVEAFAMSYYGNVEILEHPMCGKCEQPGWFSDLTPDQKPYIVKHDEDGFEVHEFTHNCYCPKCGSITKNTLLFKDYLSQELKLPVEVLKQIEHLQYQEVKE